MEDIVQASGLWGYKGLSEQEVAEKLKEGRANRAEPPHSQSYKEIIARNVLTGFNFVMLLIGAMLMAFGLHTDALMSVALIFLNVVIGLVQEIQAKRKLDEIALLTRPKVTILRDGREETLDPSSVVQDDEIVFRPGDQMVVDGKVLREENLRVDESLITGESDPVPRKEGDTVLSGSFCISGMAVIETEKVGMESLMNRLATGAKSYRQVLTPLQQDVNLVIRILMGTALMIGFLKAVSALLNGSPLVQSVQSAAVIAGIVPIGLFMAVIVAYSLGAVRIAGKGALVQQSNAVESLSHVDVLCMDKTGTITANRIKLERINPLEGSLDEVKSLLGSFASSMTLANATAEAIKGALGGMVKPLDREVPFSSEWKWSAMALQEAPGTVYVLGAWEALQGNVTKGRDAIEPLVKEAATMGMRVLLFCEARSSDPLFDKDENPLLPPSLAPRALAFFSDELRKGARETLEKLAKAKIKLKIISGDSPETVLALARQAGLQGEVRLVYGPDIEAMSPPERSHAAKEGVIFGRVTPQQKEMLIDALKERGFYVAMIGDGVNDVLALKKANLGIALQSGTGAARSVSDIVLLNDSFEAIPHALIEGRRIVNGMRSILSLYMTRSLYVALIIIAAEFVGAGFPYAPKQAALLSILTVGIPSFCFALWARPEFPRKRLLYSILHYVLPATFSIVVFGLIVYTLYFYLVHMKIFAVGIMEEQIMAYMQWAGMKYRVSNEDAIYEMARAVAQIVLTHFTILSGLLLVVFAEPPHPLFTGGNPLSSDKKPAYLVLAIFVLYVASLAFRQLHLPLEVLRLSPLDYLLIALLTVFWALMLRGAWRRRLLERFLQMDFDKAAAS
ncbi:MAG: HAD-IC family P-type ATPase [Candidatus Eremiobacteraeota bacterium]|nr:HAD-IC family P-type ATPase [Candidatus Eremiobacteraeota bacterium]